MLEGMQIPKEFYRPVLSCIVATVGKKSEIKLFNGLSNPTSANIEGKPR